MTQVKRLRPTPNGAVPAIAEDLLHLADYPLDLPSDLRLLRHILLKASSLFRRNNCGRRILQLGQLVRKKRVFGELHD